LKFYIQDKRPIVAEITMPGIRYCVCASYDKNDPVNYTDRWLAEFASFEDAQEFKKRMEEEYLIRLNFSKAEVSALISMLDAYISDGDSTRISALKKLKEAMK